MTPAYLPRLICPVNGVLVVGIIAVWAAIAHAGEISPAGSAIEVESYRCEVTSARGIRCLNIGRTCDAVRAKEKIDNDKMFGCALENSPNYPCPPWGARMKELERTRDERMACSTITFGAW